MAKAYTRILNGVQYLDGSKFLVINRSGKIRIADRTPSLEADEISISLNFRIPISLFDKPRLTATIELPPSSVLPEVIPVELQDQITDAIKKGTGVNVTLSIAE